MPPGTGWLAGLAVERRGSAIFDADSMGLLDEVMS
jgi:hypothetical protein